MTHWAGRVVAITGGSGGVGSALARWYVTSGASVALIGWNIDTLTRFSQELAAEGHSVSHHVADVSDEKDVADVVSAVIGQWGRVDVFINNAAIADDTDLVETTPERWDAQHGIVLRGPYLCSRAVLPGMRERGRGVIVNISSVNALFHVGNEVYSAAKAGLNSLTRSIAVRYGPDGIRAVGIAPGTIATAIWNRRLERDPQTLDRVSRWYPIGRVGRPEDIAHLAGFVTSDEASWLTGTTIALDGGLTAGNSVMAADILGEHP